MKMKNIIIGLVLMGSLTMVGCESTTSVEDQMAEEDKIGVENAMSYAEEDAAEIISNGERVKVSDIVYRMEEIVFDEDNILDTDVYIEEMLKYIDIEGLSDGEASEAIKADYDVRSEIALAQKGLSEEFAKYNCYVVLTPLRGVEGVYEGTIHNNDSDEIVGVITQYDKTTGNYKYKFY